MSRIASADDFHARYNPDGSQIPNTGNLYTDYGDSPKFTHRALCIQSIFPTSVGKVVVAGVGYGYLVRELVALGYDAWGFDAAQYAVGQATGRLAFGIASRVLAGNVSTRGDLNQVKSAAGLGTNQPFGLCVVEDLHSACNSDQEVGVGLAEIRRSQFSTRRFHIITAVSQAQIDTMNGLLPGLLWKTMAQWRTLIGVNQEPIMGAEGPPYVLDRGSGATEVWTPPAGARLRAPGTALGPSKLERI